ncbi:MAG: hypothetical protein ACE5EN_04255 [Nitrospinota bacterium]
MREFTTSLIAVILPVFIAIVLAACGSSPGGSDFGGGSSADTTPPVTSVDKDSGNVSRNQVITFTCTDNSSGCKETWLSGELSGASAQFFKAYDISASGTSTSFTVQISGTHTVGSTYDYQFYSIDNSNNQETTKSRLYTVIN